MKALVDGADNKVMVKAMYEKAFEMAITFSITIICNDMPDLSSTYGGIAHRLRKVPFDVKFVDEPNPDNVYQAKLDPDFMNNIGKPEIRDAFIKMLIDRWITRVSTFKKIPVPRKIIESTAEYIGDSNPILGFINDRFDITNNVNDTVNASRLFSSYKAYDSNCKMQMRDFKKEVLHISGIGHTRNNQGQIYTGLKKKPIIEEENPK